jgi:phage gpG-like protein
LSEVKNIAEIFSYIKGLTDVTKRAATKAQIQTILAAENQAKLNAKRQFTGINPQGEYRRILSGNLLNSIYSGYEQEGENIPSAFLGVHTIPYAAIHEFGTTGRGGTFAPIVPVRKKWLTIPMERQYTKRRAVDFPLYFRLLGGTTPSGGRRAALFDRRTKKMAYFLTDKVELPPRPYLTPAVEQEFNNWPIRFQSWLHKEINR